MQYDGTVCVAHNNIMATQPSLSLWFSNNIFWPERLINRRSIGRGQGTLSVGALSGHYQLSTLQSAGECFVCLAKAVLYCMYEQGSEFLAKG